MPIPLYSMLLFSIISHRASLNRLQHRLSAWVWVVLYLFFFPNFPSKSSSQTWSHSFYLHVQATLILKSLLWLQYLGIIFGSQFFFSFNSPLSMLTTRHHQTKNRTWFWYGTFSECALYECTFTECTRTMFCFWPHDGSL